MSDNGVKEASMLVHVIKTFWQSLVGVIGFVFFLGGLSQRTASQAEIAASQAQTMALQQAVQDLVKHEREHDRAITELTTKLDDLTDLIRSQQKKVR